jgi:hypothetical protein
MFAKIADRASVSIALPENTDICYTVDGEKKFTTCLLRLPAEDPNEAHRTVYVGNSKRVTHLKRKDKYNEGVGRVVAFRRAAISFLQGECSFDA